jgi:predicted secreted protein
MAQAPLPQPTDQPKSDAIRHPGEPRMHRLAANVRRTALVAMVAFLAGALPLTPARADDTILRLSETATVMVVPDELAAALRAETTAPNAQDAQKRVNEMMRDAIAAAKKVDGVIVSSGGYNVWRVGPTPGDRVERWQAAQSLNLSGKDSAAMLKLVGELQQMGLAQGNLVWRLSRQTERTARQDATKQALSGLRGRADDAAEILGMKFASFKEVRLDSVAPPPIMPRQAMTTRASMAAIAQPPSAEAEDMPVTASAEADIVLKPR